jgi:uncharacterized protein (TIGR02996 family)
MISSDQVASALTLKSQSIVRADSSRVPEHAMTSDGDALFRAICEQPWEDTPRLVYADWLDENGQPERAEFIRLQIELAAIPPNKRWNTPQQERTNALQLEWDPVERQVAMKVAKRSEKSWSADLPTGKGVEWEPWYWRGFRHAVTFSSMKAVGTHADAVVMAGPVDRVTVKRLQPLTVAPLLALPWVARLNTLHLSGNVGAVGAEAIARSTALGRLECLDLSNAQMTDAALKILAGATNLPNLRRLELEGNTHGVTEAGLNEVMKSRTLKKLKAVDGVRFTLLPLANPLHIYVEFYKRFPNSQ